MYNLCQSYLLSLYALYHSHLEILYLDMTNYCFKKHQASSRDL